MVGLVGTRLDFLDVQIISGSESRVGDRYLVFLLLMIQFMNPPPKQRAELVQLGGGFNFVSNF